MRAAVTRRSARAEAADTDQVGGDERVLERDKRVERGLGVGEHLLREVEGREARGLVREAFLEHVMRHLLLERGLQVALVVGLEVLEERGRGDDVRVGGDGERLGDLGRLQDRDVAPGGTVRAFARKGRGGAEGSDAGGARAGRGGSLQEAEAGRVPLVAHLACTVLALDLLCAHRSPFGSVRVRSHPAASTAPRPPRITPRMRCRGRPLCEDRPRWPLSSLRPSCIPSSTASPTRPATTARGRAMTPGSRRCSSRSSGSRRARPCSSSAPGRDSSRARCWRPGSS